MMKLSELPLYNKKLEKEMNHLGLDTTLELARYNPLRDGWPSQDVSKLVELAEQARRLREDRGTEIDVGNRTWCGGTRLYGLPDALLLPLRDDEELDEESRIRSPFEGKLMFPRGAGANETMHYRVREEGDEAGEFRHFYRVDDDQASFTENPNFLHSIQNTDTESETPYYLYGSGSSAVYRISKGTKIVVEFKGLRFGGGGKKEEVVKTTVVDTAFSDAAAEYVVSTEDVEEDAIDEYILKDFALGARRVRWSEEEGEKRSEFEPFYQLDREGQWSVIHESFDSAKRFIPLLLHALRYGRNICSDGDPSSAVWNGVIYEMQFKVKVLSDAMERWTVVTRQRFTENQLDFLLKRAGDGSVKECCRIPANKSSSTIQHLWLNFLWMPQRVQCAPFGVHKKRAWVDQYLLQRGIAEVSSKGTPHLKSICELLWVTLRAGEAHNVFFEPRSSRRWLVLDDGLWQQLRDNSSVHTLENASKEKALLISEHLRRASLSRRSTRTCCCFSLLLWRASSTHRMEKSGQGNTSLCSHHCSGQGGHSRCLVGCSACSFGFSALHGRTRSRHSLERFSAGRTVPSQSAGRGQRRLDR